MDSKTMENQIEQLEVQLSGAKGMLNEIVSMTRLFMPLLYSIPQSDKKMLAELDKRMQIVEMQLSMERLSPPTIVSAKW